MVDIARAMLHVHEQQVVLLHLSSGCVQSNTLQASSSTIAILSERSVQDVQVTMRDLKPDNVLLTADLRQAKVIDFGLGKIRRKRCAMSESGSPVGSKSPFFMHDFVAPELLTGDDYTAQVCFTYASQ